MTNTLPKAAVLLERKGSQLFSLHQRWDMMGVHGPLATSLMDSRPCSVGIAPDLGQYFRIETASEETLWVFRPAADIGMRQVFLLAVT